MLGEVKGRMKVLMVGLVMNVLVVMIRRNEVYMLVEGSLGSEVVEIEVMEGMKVIISLMVLISVVGIVPLVWIVVYMLVCKGLRKEEGKEVRKFLVIISIFFVIVLVIVKPLYWLVRSVVFRFRNIGIVSIESIEVIGNQYSFIVWLIGIVIVIMVVGIVMKVLIMKGIISYLSYLGSRRIVVMMICLGSSLFCSLEVMLVGSVGGLVLLEGIVIVGRMKEGSASVRFSDI